MLLRAKNRSWSSDTYPANEIRCWEFVMLHCVTCYQASCSAKSSFTMNCNGTFLFFDSLQKFINNCRLRCSSISKNKIMMLNSLFKKPMRVISFIVQPQNHFYPHLFKDWNIVSWRKHSILQIINKKYPIFIYTWVIRRTKRNKLIWYDPIQITVFNPFIMFIFIQVELLVIKPTNFYRILQSSQTIQ